MASNKAKQFHLLDDITEAGLEQIAILEDLSIEDLCYMIDSRRRNNMSLLHAVKLFIVEYYAAMAQILTGKNNEPPKKQLESCMSPHPVTQALFAVANDTSEKPLH